MPLNIAHIAIDKEHAGIRCLGEWILSGLSELPTQIDHFTQWPTKKVITLDVSGITKMDTAGALALFHFTEELKERNYAITLQGCTSTQQELLNLVKTAAKKIHTPTPRLRLPWLAKLGKQAIDAYGQMIIFLALLGEIFVRAAYWIRFPQRIQWKSLCSTIELTGYHALPIIGLLSFLIGIVLAYQMGIQLRNYGANIFVINLIGLSVLREFAPLMTAIIIAGRTGSAFAAQLGTMQVNEEVDALRTMGIAPVEYLVLQKFFGLVIALPLLTVWSDVTGVLGGMVMANNMLNISYYEFLHRFQQVITLKTYVIGLVKAPVFAAIIASIGCYQGFQVKGSAESVGQHTTRSVVQAIFMIICADALFSVLLSWYKI